MDLKVVRFIREASERQLVDVALVFIQRYPDVALELCSEAPEPGVEITPKDVSCLPKAVFISDTSLAELQSLYRNGDKITVVKQVRNIFNYGLNEALKLVEYLIDKNYLKSYTGSDGFSVPAPPPRF